MRWSNTKMTAMHSLDGEEHIEHKNSLKRTTEGQHAGRKVDEDSEIWVRGMRTR